MSKEPQYISLFQFFKTYPDEAAANTFFETARWPQGIRCPRCDKKETIRVISTGKPQPYHCRECRKYFSVKVGTVMEASPIPLRAWLMTVYLMTVSRKGISSCQLARQLSIQQRSAYFLINRVREAWKTSPFMLSGNIEIDESYFGGKEKNKHADKKVEGTQGRSTKTKKPVLGLYERGGNVRATVVKDTSRETIYPLIFSAVKRESLIFTDEYRAYRGLTQVYSAHYFVNHSAKEYVDGMVHTNNLECFWSHLKRGITGINHWVSHKHLQSYVNEYALRFNTRKHETNRRFDLILENIAGRLTYKNLIA